MKIRAALLSLLFICASGSGEDMDLRSHAEQLMNHAFLASRLTTPINIRTNVSFSVTGSDGLAKQGTYIRVRSTDGALREDTIFGEYSMSRIEDHGQVWTHGQWADVPYTVRKVFEFVPYFPIRFDTTDVITAIENTNTMGKASTCIQFITVRGEDHNPGDVCLSKVNGTVLEWHDRDRSFQVSDSRTVSGALLPAHFVYREGTTLILDATVKWTLLDARPDEAFLAPENWHQARFCSTSTVPIPIKSPQPQAKGGIDAPIATVVLRVHVRSDGSVGGAVVLQQIRADLDEEALELVKTWTFQPGTCEGNKQQFSIDVPVHFQGR